MQSLELFRQHLPIEADLLDFNARLLDAAEDLGGSRFAVVERLLELTTHLRQAGAASGYPLLARVLMNDSTLLVRWGEEGGLLPLLRLRQLPARARVEALAERLRRETEVADPVRLQMRNREMALHLDEVRQRTEKELQQLQQNLEARQAELHVTLREAETDPLTGLLNRRAFDDRIERAFRRTLRQRGEALSLIMLDLDYFKEVNDLHGHQYGDDYLRRMADALRSAIRSDVDFAFRFGGDEFTVLMFADASNACRKSMSILQRMEGKVSIGISSIAPGATFDGELRDFIRSADEALYAAKRAGRGRVVADLCRNSSDGCQMHCGRAEEGEEGEEGLLYRDDQCPGESRVSSGD